MTQQELVSEEVKGRLEATSPRFEVEEKGKDLSKRKLDI